MTERTGTSRILTVIVALVVLGATAFGIGRAGLFETVFKAEVAPLDFAKLERGNAPSYLVAPDGFTPGKSDGEAPVLGLSVEKAKANWETMIARQPDVVKVAQSEDGLQIDYVQRSKVLRLPDVITVRFIPMPSDPETGDYSTLAVYSRSLYAFGAAADHQARVTKWLNGL
jgi:hypothetical protein